MAYKLCFIEPPEEELGPKEALRWLREDFPAYSLAGRYGYEQCDKDVETPFYYLMGDVEEMTIACVEAISTRKAVRVTRDESAFNNTTQELARIICTQLESDSGVGQPAFAALGRTLVRRLGEEADDAR